MTPVAAASLALTGVAAWRGLPRFRPTTQMRYTALLASLATLWRQHGALRRATLAQGLLLVGFRGFWSTLAVVLHGAPFHLASAAAGAFGLAGAPGALRAPLARPVAAGALALAGAAGALAAPLAGRVADRKGPELVTRLGAAVVVLSFAALALAPLLGTQAQLGLLVACAVGFDLGFQGTLIAHQTIVYGIDPGARSRLNAVLFTGMFIGMASGSALGALVFAEWGWIALVLLATGSALAGLFVRMVGFKAAIPA